MWPRAALLLKFFKYKNTFVCIYIYKLHQYNNVVPSPITLCPGWAGWILQRQLREAWSLMQVIERVNSHSVVA
jgi:hypothetical protein